MEQERLTIELPNRMVVLQVQPFDGDIDTEALLSIDYGNIVGELLTFSVVYNRIGNLKAEAANVLAEAKLDFEVYEAQKYEEHRSKCAAASDKAKGPSIKDIDTAVLRDPAYVTKKKGFLRRQRDYDYIESLYWSATDKSKKLDKLTERVSPEEFSTAVLEGSINNVMIRTRKKAIS